MDKRFYIYSITVGSDNAEDTSTVKFRDGLNILSAKSDRGKSMVFKALYQTFGAEKSTTSDKQLEKFTWAESVFKRCDGSVTLKLRREKGVITVSSISSESTQKESYSVKNFSKNLLDVLLEINKDTKLPSTVSGKPQNITLLNMFHLFLLQEVRVIEEPSCILGDMKYRNSTTFDMSLLHFLLSGETHEEYLAKENVQQFGKRKEGYQERLKDELADCESMKVQNQMRLDELEASYKIDYSLEDIQERMAGISYDVEEAERSRARYNKALFEIEDEIISCKILQANYKNLMNQYISDVNKLEFIAEGYIAIGEEHQENALCPFCNEPMHAVENSIDSKQLVKELNQLVDKINDLKESQKDLDGRLRKYLKKQAVIKAEISNVTAFIDETLAPQQKLLSSSKEKLREYFLLCSQRDFIKEKIEAIKKKQKEKQAEKLETKTYHAADMFPEKFSGFMTEEIREILKACSYDSFEEVSFDTETCDLLIDSKEKSEEGKGWRAFFNTVNHLALKLMLHKYGMYKIPFTILDTPTLGLDEGESDGSKSVRYGLFKYLDSNYADYGQLIILENTEHSSVEYKMQNAYKVFFGEDEENKNPGFIKGYISKHNKDN